MAENSGIEWTDNTFNPWMGCTKVSPACKNCYAERDFDHRYQKVKWGPSGTRVVTSDANWRKPIKWNREAGEGFATFTHPTEGLQKTPYRARVFCASLADVFEDWNGPMHDHNGNALWVDESGFWVTDDGMPGFAYRKRHVTMNDVRHRLFKLIDTTPNLDWLLLTKRPENIGRMWPTYFPGGYIAEAGSMNEEGPRPNVWLGTSVENQEYANTRIPQLMQCRDLSPVLFLSCEPLVGPVDLAESIVCGCGDHGPYCIGCDRTFIDWVITGGESGPDARPCDPEWFQSLRDQCENDGIPFHFKQWGEFDKHQIRVGKKTAGRLLDGRTHDGIPLPKIVA
jgi:protein gp37